MNSQSLADVPDFSALLAAYNTTSNQPKPLPPLNPDINQKNFKPIEKLVEDMMDRMPYKVGEFSIPIYSKSESHVQLDLQVTEGLTKDLLMYLFTKHVSSDDFKEFVKKFNSISFDAQRRKIKKEAD